MTVDIFGNAQPLRPITFGSSTAQLAPLKPTIVAPRTAADINPYNVRVPNSQPNGPMLNGMGSTGVATQGIQVGGVSGVTNPGAAAGTGGTTSVNYTPRDTSGLESELLKIARERQAGIDTAIKNIGAVANPNDVNSPAWQAALAGATNRATMANAGAEARLQNQFNAQGMGATGNALLSSAAQAKLGAQQVSNVQNDMYDKARVGSAAFDMAKQNAILSALTGRSPLADQLSTNLSMEREDQAANNALLAQILGIPIRAGVGMVTGGLV